MTDTTRNLGYEMLDNGHVVCTYMGEQHTLYDLDAERPEKLRALAYLGVKAYVSQISALRAKDSPKIDAVRAAAVTLQNKDPNKMFRSAVPSGPKFGKRDRLAALASLKGCHLSALTEALKIIGPVRSKALLYSPEVEAHLAATDAVDLGTEVQNTAGGDTAL